MSMLLTSSKAFDFQASSVTGVDIDPKLVKQANQLLALRASRTRPPTKDVGHVVDYFPISAVLTHGYRKEPGHEASSDDIWPQVVFCTADFVTSRDDFSHLYDVILALSGRLPHSMVRAELTVS
jgi:7SK snRNA methylphosphate capping enzyme